MKLPVWVGKALYWLAWPGLFLYLRRGSRSRVLVLSGQHVLLVKTWLGDGSWGLPGGGLHRGESPRDGAARELAEETGVRINAAQLQPLASELVSQHGLASFYHFFTVRLTEQPVLVPQPLEITSAAWTPINDIANSAHQTTVDRALMLLGAK